MSTLVKIMKLKFRREFEAEVWFVFCCWCLVEVTKLNLGQYSEARLGQDFNFRISRDADVCLRFWSWSFEECLIEILKLFKICELWSCDMNSILGSVVPLAMFIFCPQTRLEPGRDSNWTSRKSRRWKLDSVLCLIYTTTFLPLFHIGSTGLAIRASFFLNKTNLESYWWKCYQMQFEINPYHVTFSRWLSFKTFWLIKISLLCQTENSGSWLWWSWRHELLVGRRSSS